MMVAPVVITPVVNPLDVYGEVENTYRDGKHVLTVNINRSDRNRVSAESVKAITRKGDPGRLYIVDHGYVLDTGAALTITATDDHRVIRDTVENLSNTFDIKGVSGDPITITKKCSMFLNYTDTKGKRRQ
jgi:hypothetical protein